MKRSKRNNFLILLILVYLTACLSSCNFFDDLFDWNRNSSSGGISLSDGSDTETTYYSVIFDKNDAQATGSMENQSIPEGESASLSSLGFTYFSHSFDGWAATDTGSAIYTDCCSFTMGNSDETLYAKWTEILPQMSQIQASDRQSEDNFGSAVSIQGDYALIGAPNEDSGGSNSGAAYVFKREGDSWIQKDILYASNASIDSGFGKAVSLYGDYALVGANMDDTAFSNAGAAYIYKRDGENWIYQDILTADNASSNSQFGVSVSLYEDYALVGALDESSNATYAGAAYIFKRVGDSWSQQGDMLYGSDTTGIDKFGVSVSLNGDYAIVGAFCEDTGGGDAGAAYIFKRDGESWNETVKIQANDKAASDYFGSSVSIFGDYALVGAYGVDNGENNAGAAYIFKRVSENWEEQDILYPSSPVESGLFGQCVSLSGDYAVAGVRRDHTWGSDAGTAYLFKRVGSNWIEERILYASDAQADDYFGSNVSISGNYVMVGAANEDGGGGDPVSNAGSVYFFR